MRLILDNYVSIVDNQQPASRKELYEKQIWSPLNNLSTFISPNIPWQSDWNQDYSLMNSYWYWDVNSLHYKDKYISQNKTLNYSAMRSGQLFGNQMYSNSANFECLQNMCKSNQLLNNVYDLNEAVEEECNPVIFKTVEEVLQSQILSDIIKSNPNYGRSKRRLYYLRQDVIIKVIFRSMRKYYLRDFKTFFDFSKCSSSNNSDTNGVLIQQINKYLKSKFGDKTQRNMGIYFLSVIDIKERFMSISEHHRRLKESISELLYCYNKPKLLNLINCQQFALMLLYFLNKRDILRLVVKSQNDAETIQTYWEQIQMLKCQWNISLKMNNLNYSNTFT